MAIPTKASRCGFGPGDGTGGAAQGDTLTGIEDLSGSDFGDTLVGDEGDNRLFGGAGADALWGNSGDDVLIGGSGATRCSARPGSIPQATRDRSRASP
jgi:Ca2+-binding RTX toxin-like protein